MRLHQWSRSIKRGGPQKQISKLKSIALGCSVACSTSCTTKTPRHFQKIKYTLLINPTNYKLPFKKKKINPTIINCAVPKIFHITCYWEKKKKKKKAKTLGDRDTRPNPTDNSKQLYWSLRNPPNHPKSTTPVGSNRIHRS